MEGTVRIAVLIDGDNAQPKILKEILEEVAKYGKATIRRIYGDWTTVQMNGWKEIVNKFSFTPIQKFSYTVGKNSTDSAMIIDAMDILHDRNVDGFCIVSSDSDYTGLAKRIREAGIFVMGVGKKTTPEAFVQSCEVFVFSENISSEKGLAGTQSNQKKPNPEKTLEKKEPLKDDEVLKTDPEILETPKVNIEVIDKAFEISAGEEDQVYVSQMGINLRKIDPSFDARAFGYKTLTQLFEDLPNYEVFRKDFNGITHALVKRR